MVGGVAIAEAGVHLFKQFAVEDYEAAARMILIIDYGPYFAGAPRSSRRDSRRWFAPIAATNRCANWYRASSRTRRPSFAGLGEPRRAEVQRLKLCRVRSEWDPETLLERSYAR
jgi:hypothetical protein